MMNIQIDNPISVLNQDVSRTFLVSSKPDEKYNLFMRATLLDSIEKNYKALYICDGEYDKLQQYYEVCTLYFFYFITDNYSYLRLYFRPYHK